MIEKPVSSPMVPPIADKISTNFAALSFVTLSKVGVSKYILTNLRSFLNGPTKRRKPIYEDLKNINWVLKSFEGILYSLSLNLECYQEGRIYIFFFCGIFIHTISTKLGLQGSLKKKVWYAMTVSEKIVVIKYSS